MITGRRKRATRACIAAVVLWGFAGAARAQSGPAAAGTQSDAATKAGGDATPAATGAASSVRYYSKEQVEASFEQTGGGDTLYDGENGTRNYKIATSVRKKPGVVEVHMNLTDVCYILKGSATLLYGGKITDLIDSHFPDGRPYPKDELRGHNIVGGETRHLSAGDVIIIPNGVPHQFSQVDPPFWYYVVKVHNP
jgi:mannose-6-phosphate isomerase-like protein (cupin superfamily)